MDDKLAAAEHIDVSKEQSAPNGGVEMLDEHGNIRRIPVPSQDVNDPLNMNKWRKLGIIVTCCWYSIFSLVLVGGAGPVLPFWFQAYGPEGIGQQDIVNLTTYPSLVMVLGTFDLPSP